MSRHARSGVPNPDDPSGLVVEPPPGQSGGNIRIYPYTDVGGDLQATMEYANLHSYDEDLRSLAQEVDKAGERSGNLALEIAQKENYLGGLQKRIELLERDVGEHTGTLNAALAHIDAIQARIERLREERQMSELAAQKHQFELASKKLASEVHNVRAVSSALGSRIQRLNNGQRAEEQVEHEHMALSLQPALAAGDAEGDAEIPEEEDIPEAPTEGGGEEPTDEDEDEDGIHEDESDEEVDEDGQI